MMKMKRYIFLTAALAVFNAASVISQVTIGAMTSPKSTLEVVGKATEATVSDGVIMPRITGDLLAAKNDAYGDDQNSAIVYVTEAASTPAGKTINVTSPGYYYFDAAKDVWRRFVTDDSFFYLPSFNLDVSVLGIDSLDVYKDVYVHQFDKTLGAGPFVSSNPALTKVPGMYAADELDWVVISYDEAIIDVISISAEGMLKYEVLSADPEPTSYINIIAIPKR
ncbi:MAG: hypothetical protein LBR64_04020 [Dysgonamonadaceae bacterium]|jgi:hypothetical protein|nr:hypothetical protein [Dysgonamonadaceae bacterium]